MPVKPADLLHTSNKIRFANVHARSERLMGVVSTPLSFGASFPENPMNIHKKRDFLPPTILTTPWDSAPPPQFPVRVEYFHDRKALTTVFGYFSLRMSRNDIISTSGSKSFVVVVLSDVYSYKP